MTLPVVAVLMSRELTGRLLAPAVFDELVSVATVRRTGPAGTVADLADAQVAITGWDTPPLTDDVLRACPQLRLIAHTGGSVRRLVPESAYAQGIRITQVSGVLAEAVAEFTVMAVIAGLRGAFGFYARMRAGQPWQELEALPPGRLLRDQVVGIVGASRVGRAVIARLAPFGCSLLVHDPYLDEDGARALGVHVTGLDDLMSRSDVVSLHAPLLAATHGMISGERLALLRDGALVVNTARAGLVDSEALLAELKSGRISAVVDVFDQEPLPDDSVWRELPTVAPFPHLAALTRETLFEQGASAVREVHRFLAGQRLREEVTRDAYHVVA
jgi:phosphoglycerate dehydrogenase-like enzyme